MISLTTPLAGMQSGLARLDQVARERAAGPVADLAGNTVDLLRAGQQVAANAAVIRTSDEITRRTLDFFV